MPQGIHGVFTESFFIPLPAVFHQETSVINFAEVKIGLWSYYKAVLGVAGCGLSVLWVTTLEMMVRLLQSSSSSINIIIHQLSSSSQGSTNPPDHKLMSGRKIEILGLVLQICTLKMIPGCIPILGVSENILFFSNRISYFSIFFHDKSNGDIYFLFQRHLDTFSITQHVWSVV
jgi:hypothetical protein